MTCRHRDGDPDCSSHPSNVAMRQAEYERERREEADKAARAREAEARKGSPDANEYELIDTVRVGEHLVVKVRYPNCSKCAYEGVKVLVLLNVAEMAAIRWRRIDPHFRDPAIVLKPHEAPSPAARFPASNEGWSDALTYARGKVRK
jgi:hypothetical protein